jgi:predicted RND superfamily exporter protein
MINLVAFPLLIGIDVDYGIFVVSAIRRQDVRTLSRRQVAARAVPAAAAVVLCALSMILGFGSLVFTSVPAVRSLGVAVTAGVVSCVAGALLLVVPLVMLTRPETRE